jgi:hypothetical protein
MRSTQWTLDLRQSLRGLGDPFRRDALALPARHLAKYQATAAKRG